MERIEELNIIIPALREQVLYFGKQVCNPNSIDDRGPFIAIVDKVKELDGYIAEYRKLKEAPKES